ncbi:FAD-dependent oxidoreductase [Paenibacillus sp.]|jgi:glycine/D-amino acid oxidase-like deaminating enzyme/nitrite reductase/ring-hydroxylating ferredoxin subunit|uniref:FAD-dependent oxidoreductase n=1 Tax=Paenibacillus sp. TaxID=58172 RepID=UPI00281ED8DD|nr:FAD-dependent oxidoreductase [Paenibacillus sp.]MDR0267095.1 FAD-dependent oxidoreductase [Paenibacillus sp.]
MKPSDSVSKSLPQFPESLWKATTEFPTFPRLNEDIQTDVAIVGAGIAGVTTAYLLARQGCKVALLDAGSILNGTTGHTTAKVSAQHGMIYDELLNHFGKEQAKMYYQANMDAKDFIQKTVSDLSIECDLRPEDAYIYVEKTDAVQKLQKEFDAYIKLGIPGQWREELPIPLKVKGAIEMPGQGQFHPLHYLKPLVDEIIKAGGKIFEHTTIASLEEESPFTLTTYHGKHKVRCSHVVSASHFPFLNKGLYFSRLHAERSYALAIQPETPFAGGMYLSVDEPKRSLRSAMWNGEEVVLIGGESHKTGQSICTHNHYEELEKFGSKLFGNKGIPFRWSAQDLITLDKVPYIGLNTSGDRDIYIATGFNKWGMTHGTLSGMILSDLVLGKTNPYSLLYNPSRFKADPAIKNFVVQNADVAKHLVAGKVGLIERKIEDLKPDEGGVVKHDGKRAGAYKDATGNLYLVDTTCTHMGCEVEWNDGERSWDCPCHGSRFNYEGKVLEGPAIEPLKKLDVRE